MTAVEFFRFQLDDGDYGTIVCNDNAAFVYFDRRVMLEKGSASYTTFVGRQGRTWSESTVLNALNSMPMGSGNLPSKVKEVQKTKLGPGQYHPRIWRQFGGPSPDIYGDTYTDSLVAFDNIERDLEEIFRTIEPSTDNDQTYGHALREALILACTEVEAQLKGIMLANGVGKKDADRMEHYRAALPILMLSDWAVRLRRYSRYPVIKPFAGWSNTAPLSWYTSYNKTKHDRDANFKHATLENVIKAAAGVAVLLMGQYGAALVNNPFYPHSLRFRVFEAAAIARSPLELQYIPPGVAQLPSWIPVEKKPFTP